jgi:hypothetical protein
MVTPISSMPGDCASASMATPSSKPSTMSLSKITFSRADTGKAHNRDTITPKTTSHSRFHRLMRPSFHLRVKKELPAFPIRMEQGAVSDAVVPMCGKTFSCPCFFLLMRWRLLAQAVWGMNGPREERFIRCTGPLGNRRQTERAPRGLKCENTAGYTPLSTSESTDGNALLRNVTS